MEINMKLKRNDELLKEIADILSIASTLQNAVNADKEVDMSFLKDFDDKCFFVRNSLHKWQDKVRKDIAESINPGSTKKSKKSARIKKMPASMLTDKLFEIAKTKDKEDDEQPKILKITKNVEKDKTD